jgi:hypothetical protein
MHKSFFVLLVSIFFGSLVPLSAQDVIGRSVPGDDYLPVSPRCIVNPLNCYFLPPSVQFQASDFSGLSGVGSRTGGTSGETLLSADPSAIFQPQAPVSPRLVGEPCEVFPEMCEELGFRLEVPAGGNEAGETARSDVALSPAPDQSNESLPTIGTSDCLSSMNDLYGFSDSISAQVCEYLESAQAAACDQGAFALYERGINALGAYRYIADARPTEEDRQILLSYLECFSPIGQTSVPSELTNRVGQRFFRGVDAPDPRSRFVDCSGLVLDEEYEVFLTARHCFDEQCPTGSNCSGANPDPLELLIDTRVWSLGQDPSSRFTLTFFEDVATAAQALNNPSFSLEQLSELILPGSRNPGESGNWVPTDAIILRMQRLSGSFSPSLGPPISTARPQVGQALAILGVNNHLISLTTALNQPITHITHIDRSPLCLITRIDDACVYNFCQTESGMSGAAVFAAIDGQWMLVAVHSDGFSSAERPEDVGCPSREVLGVENVGVALQ